MFLHCDGLCHLLLDHKPKGINVTCAEALSKHALSRKKEELEEKREGWETRSQTNLLQP